LPRAYFPSSGKVSFFFYFFKIVEPCRYFYLLRCC